jgi:hypothetical protein
LKPADLKDRISAIEIVRVAGEEPAVDTHYDEAAYVGCGVSVFKVPVEVDP